MIWGEVIGEKGPEPGRIEGGRGTGGREGPHIAKPTLSPQKLSNVWLCPVEGVERGEVSFN